MSLTLTILGCGNSSGVPAIGNYWGKCDPTEPRNNRMRASACVQRENTTLIIDTGPDFKQQINRADNIHNIDAVLYTHAHSDHINGIDELRGVYFRNQALVPIYGDESTISELKRRYEYLFQGGKLDIYPPILQETAFKAKDYGQNHQIGDISFTPFLQDHGSCQSVGYRFGDLAYSTDMLDLDETAVETLKGIKTWIVDGCGYHNEDNVAHANLKTLYKLNEQISAEQIYLTSLSLLMDYKTMIDELPEGYEPAYDGLSLKAL